MRAEPTTSATEGPTSPHGPAWPGRPKAAQPLRLGPLRVRLGGSSPCEGPGHQKGRPKLRRGVRRAARARPRCGQQPIKRSIRRCPSRRGSGLTPLHKASYVQALRELGAAHTARYPASAHRLPSEPPSRAEHASATGRPRQAGPSPAHPRTALRRARHPRTDLGCEAGQSAQRTLPCLPSLAEWLASRRHTAGDPCPSVFSPQQCFARLLFAPSQNPAAVLCVACGLASRVGNDLFLHVKTAKLSISTSLRTESSSIPRAPAIRQTRNGRRRTACASGASSFPRIVVGLWSRQSAPRTASPS